MKRALRSILILLLLAASFLFGSFQEWVKVNINFHLDAAIKIVGYDGMSAVQREQAVNAYRLIAPYDYYYNHSPLSGLAHFSVRNLSVLKWSMTPFFVTIFFLLNVAVTGLLFSSRKLFRWVFYLYAIFFALSFGLYIAGMLLGAQDHFYNVARKITGALQSPVPLMLIVPAWWMYKEKVKSKKVDHDFN